MCPGMDALMIKISHLLAKKFWRKCWAGSEDEAGFHREGGELRPRHLHQSLPWHHHATTYKPSNKHIKKSSSTCAQKGCQRHNLGYWVLNPFNSVNIHEPPEGQIGPAIKPNSSCMLLDKMILFGFNILLLNFSLTMPWGPLDCRMFVHPSWELYKVC